MKSSHFARALWFGILAALFFAFTFIFNRSMNLAGGSWMWSASLRYLFSLPMMAVLVWQKGELKGVLSAIARARGLGCSGVRSDLVSFMRPYRWLLSMENHGLWLRPGDYLF